MENPSRVPTEKSRSKAPHAVSNTVLAVLNFLILTLGAGAGSDVLIAVVVFPLTISAFFFFCFSTAAPLSSGKKSSFRQIYLFMLVITFISLSCMILDGGGRGSTAAEAGNIISELRNLRAATMTYRANRSESADIPPSALLNHVEALKRYLDNPEKIVPERYTFRTGTSSRTWWIGYRTDDVRPELMEKLAGRAKNTGLYGSPRFDMPPLAPHESLRYKKGDGAIWMPVDVSKTDVSKTKEVQS